MTSEWRPPRAQSKPGPPDAPFAACDPGNIRYREQRFPDIGSPIVQRSRNFRPRSGDAFLVLDRELPATLANFARIQITQPIAWFVAPFALHANDNAAVGQRFRQMPNRRNALRAPAAIAAKHRRCRRRREEAQFGSISRLNLRCRRRRKETHFGYSPLPLTSVTRHSSLAANPYHIRIRFMISRIEDAAEFIVALAEGVGFVD